MREVAVAKVLSSPFLRCVETVAPLASALELEVESVVYLSEGEDEDNAIAELLDVATISAPRAVVACSHGDVIPAILDLLIAKGAEFSGTRTVRKGASFELIGNAEGFTAIVGIPAPSPS